jgi:Flp pilus assembly protein TadD
MAKGPSGPADETGKTATERASDALSQRDLEATARALGEAIEEPDHAPELESAYVVALLRTGNVDKARQALATARQKRPDDLELRYAGVEVSVAAGQLDTAASELNGFADAARDDRWLRASARVASLALKRPEALAALEKIKQPAPGDGRRIAEICVELAQKASDEGKPADALAALEKAILRAPDWATPRRRLGLLCLEQGQNDQAKLQLDRAVQLAPDEPAPRLGLGIALDRLGDKAGALEAYRAFLARSKAESEKSDREAVAARVRVLEGKP